jgi:hypothetical protein
VRWQTTRLSRPDADGLLLHGDPAEAALLVAALKAVAIWAIWPAGGRACGKSRSTLPRG